MHPSWRLNDDRRNRIKGPRNLPIDTEKIRRGAILPRDTTMIVDVETENVWNMSDVKPGDQFNPTLQEALLTAPGPKDQILEILENGYMLGERVLKQVRVKVGNGE